MHANTRIHTRTLIQTHTHKDTHTHTNTNIHSHTYTHTNIIYIEMHVFTLSHDGVLSLKLRANRHGYIYMLIDWDVHDTHT